MQRPPAGLAHANAEGRAGQDALATAHGVATWHAPRHAAAQCLASGSGYLLLLRRLQKLLGARKLLVSPIDPLY